MLHRLVTLLAFAFVTFAACTPSDPVPAGDGDGDTTPPDPGLQLLPDPSGVEAGPTAPLGLGEIEPVIVGHFVTSAACAMCHSNSPNATAMRDAAGRELGPFNLWQGTMMANAGRDPFWRAMVSAEMVRTPAAGDAIVNKCMRCHTPMASVSAEEEGFLANLPMLQGDRGGSIEQLALDGVSCTVCHQIKPDNLDSEESRSGGFEINDQDIIWGPHQNPAPGPMQAHVGKTPTYSTHVLKPELCATCHTLSTSSLTEDGQPDGRFFLEQSPYLEW